MSAFKQAKNTPAAATAKAQPVGDVIVKVGGFKFFERAVWAESTGKVEILNDFNELVLNDPTRACEILMNMLKAGEMEITYEARTEVANTKGFDWSKFG